MPMGQLPMLLGISNLSPRDRQLWAPVLPEQRKVTDGKVAQKLPLVVSLVRKC